MRYFFFYLSSFFLFNFSVFAQGNRLSENFIHSILVKHNHKQVNDSLLKNLIDIGDAFAAYTISKLWQEDSCGTKEYRRNIIGFLDTQRDRFDYKPDDIIRLLGTPDQISDDSPIIIYDYILRKDEKCSTVKEVAAFLYNDKNQLKHISITLVNVKGVVNDAR